MTGQNIGQIQRQDAITYHGYIIISKVQPQTSRLVNILLENNESHLNDIAIAFLPLSLTIKLPN